MLKLKIGFFAGALAIAGSSALAFELPDTGSKNFSASGDTPTYFKNEQAPVSARTADTTERDWSAVDEVAPARAAAEPRSVAHRNPGLRQGRYASFHRSAKYAVGVSGARVAASRFSNAHTGRSTAVGAGKTSSARHGKSSAPHA